MKFSSTFIALAIAATFVSAEVQPRAAGQVSHPRHHQRSDAIREKAERREAVERQEAQDFLEPKKRGSSCKSKSKKSKSKSSSGSGSGSNNSSAKSANKQASSKDSSSKSDDSKSSSSSGSGSGSGGVVGAIGKGLFGMTSSCGASQASNSDPNGAKWWLNCGADNDGWQPPTAKLSQIKVISDDDAANASVFAPCKKYASQFKAAHASTGIPVAILMSIAMQESTCNPSVTGSRGEIGMMQLTKDKCGSAPGGNCYDTQFNIEQGGKYLKDTTDSFGGNFIEALGQYNGWTKGMKASGSCGPQGQNMNYLNGNLNGFFQGKDGYGSGGGC